MLAPPLCRRCSRPLTAASVHPDFICLDCRTRRSPVDRTIALWSYESPVDAVIRGLKFAGFLHLARPLGHCLAERIRVGRERHDCVAHVPLHWRRRLVRGYDQAEELAKQTARALASEFVRPLRRRRSTRPQSRLAKPERTSNVAAAFSARAGAAVRGRRVLLIDDVMTSGATLRAAATILKRLGARSVTAAVIARTPEPRRSRARPKGPAVAASRHL